MVGLLVIRLRRLISFPESPCSGSSACTNHHNDNECHDCCHNNTKDAVQLVQIYLDRHVPEQNQRLLRQLSLTLLASSIFGILYTGLGARFLNHNLHPEYTFWHYKTHLTLAFLYLVVGWKGWLESSSSSHRLLPADSIRASLIMALLGESLLWYDHAAIKVNAIDARLHTFLALISFLTACSILWNMILLSQQQRTASTSSTALVFVSYLGGCVGIFWQGLWFFVVATHQKWPLPSTSHVTIVFVLLAVGLGLAVQFVTVYMNLLWRQRLLSQPEFGAVKGRALQVVGQNNGEYAPLSKAQDSSEGIMEVS